MKSMTLRLAFLLMLVFVYSTAFADEYSETIKTFNESPEGQKFFHNSYGYAVFPTIGKGGFVIGVAHGDGRVYVHGKETGTSSVTQVSVGAQVGGQAYSQIVFFEDKRAYEEFTSGNFEFSAQASAIAITTGAQAQAGTSGKSASANPGPGKAGKQEAKYYKGMAVLVYTKGGFMFEASLGGEKYSFNPVKKTE